MDLLDLEKRANRLRQRIDDSEFVEVPVQGDKDQMESHKLSVEIVSDDEWDFDKRPSRGDGTASMLEEYLKLLNRAGDKIKIGPFESPALARRAQSQLGHIAHENLRWPRKASQDGSRLVPSYASHLKIAGDQAYIFVMRTYSPAAPE